MNNEILKYLMEDAQFTDVINSLYDDEIITEDLFTRKGYIASESEYSTTISSRSTVYDTPGKSLRYIIGSKCKGKLKEWSKYQSHINEYDTTIFINKKYENLLNTKVFLYTCEIKDNFMGNDKRYGTQIKDSSRITNTENDTLRNFARKYNIKIEIENSDNNTDRKSILSDVISIFKTELKTLKNKYPINDSITMYNDEDKDDFIDGVEKSISIASYDLWKFSENPRDTDEQNKFWKYANELMTNVNKKISKHNAKIDADGGDWDDGYFNLIIK